LWVVILVPLRWAAQSISPEEKRDAMQKKMRVLVCDYNHKPRASPKEKPRYPTVRLNTIAKWAMMIQLRLIWCWVSILPVLLLVQMLAQQSAQTLVQRRRQLPT